MLNEFNQLIKTLNAEKPFANMSDWGIRIDTTVLNDGTSIDLDNPSIGTFYFKHCLFVENGELAEVVSLYFCIKERGCTSSEADYYNACETRFKKLFP